MTKEQQIKIQRCIDEFYSNRPQVRDELGAALQVLYEAEPVRHGRWEKKGISIKGIEKEFCSECKTWSYGRSKAFCPNCGARMDEVEE